MRLRCSSGGPHARQVGAAARSDEQRVARDEAAVDVEALGAGRVARGVDERDGEPAHRQLGPGLDLHQVRAEAPQELALGLVDVDLGRHALEQVLHLGEVSAVTEPSAPRAASARLRLTLPGLGPPRSHPWHAAYRWAILGAIGLPAPRGGVLGAPGARLGMGVCPPTLGQGDRMMKRRKLLIALGSCALAAPLASFAQQGKPRRIGILGMAPGYDSDERPPSKRRGGASAGARSDTRATKAIRPSGRSSTAGRCGRLPSCAGSRRARSA